MLHSVCRGTAPSLNCSTPSSCHRPLPNRSILHAVHVGIHACHPSTYLRAHCRSRRNFRQTPIAAAQSALRAVAMPDSPPACELQLQANGSGLHRLKYQREGWQYWNWNDTTGQHRIHYISAGLENCGPTVLHHRFHSAPFRHLICKFRCLTVVAPEDLRAGDCSSLRAHRYPAVC